MIQFLFCWFIIDHPISFFRIQKREREKEISGVRERKEELQEERENGDASC
ncbi:hypothetical protein HanRHA438_Chr01g0028011 [Helianthus annuus]|nr:hypothetical protein HanRHA438_Chr01g0028011 [Helianthus annuus]KAJ0957374.1 hypothetical protein HanPSC8_Chr01g0026541 [Helianthus annuus]